MFFEVLEQTGLFPDKDGMINFLLFLIILIGFLVLVLNSKKYADLWEKIEKYF